MRKQFNQAYHKFLVFLHLSPMSLAEKCRFAFGAAVVLVLALALSVPYLWMWQLTKKASLDANRAKSERLLRNHFQGETRSESALAMLSNAGNVMEPNERELYWIRFDEKAKDKLAKLTAEKREMIQSLKDQSDREDKITFIRDSDVPKSVYVRVFRAREGCLSCHNPEGSAGAFTRNEPLGAVVIERTAKEIGKTIFMNRFWIIVAVLTGGTGAFVAFYIITQRVILRPIRQLRGLVNNVAEGNLNIRSSIKTRDEYEKLAEAFNHMLDTLQATQEKLRQSNRQLDEKIVELSERNIELYKANKLKGEFLANISHEFKTPLNAILGFAELLKEKPGMLNTEKNRRYAENIINSGKNLLNMINDLLDLAKSEAGKMELYIEEASIKELCKTVLASFSALTKKKKIKTKLKVVQKIPPVTTDPGKVRQILYNFLSNSVKFTPERGKIEIRVSTPDERKVRIEVSDTGCGISEEDQEKLFEKFRQLDGSLTRQSSGTGLGLAISKELTNLLAGEIGVESEIDKGSTFWLEIPLTLSKQNNNENKKE